MKNWRIPAVIIVLLILAILTRWSVTTRTNGNTVIKYSTDRWNGAVYSEHLGTYYRKEMINEQTIPMDWASSKGLTLIWSLLMGSNIIWLIVTLPKNINKNSKVINE